jgi:HEAT repeat protein
MLGLPPLPRTLAAALRDVVHQRNHVRQSALRDLVRLAQAPDSRESAIAALERALASDPSVELRAEAAVALADSEAEGAQRALLAALDDQALNVRQFATLALGELSAAGDVEVSARLRELTQANEAALRFQALLALERVAPEQALLLLERAAADPDDEVRAMAFRIAERRLAAGPKAPTWLAEAAGKALEDASGSVRAAAAFVLAALGDERANPVIVAILEGRLPISAPDDLQAAIDLALRLELARVRPALERRAFGPFGLRSDPVAWHACVALARLGHARARRVILKRLGAFSYGTRTLAVAAAGQAGMREARTRIESFRGNPRRAAPEAVEEALSALESAESTAVNPGLRTGD